MMAFEPPAKAMLDQPGGAIRAFEFETAASAHGDRRIAAAIEKQERLLATRQSLGDGLDQHRRQPFAALRVGCPHVYCHDVGKARRLVALLELDVPVAPWLAFTRLSIEGVAEPNTTGCPSDPRSTAMSRA